MTASPTPERGAITLLVGVLGVAFVLVAGLALDGGRKIGALQRSRDLADNAARAGAQQLDTDAYRADGTITLSPDAATAARGYLAAHGTTGTITITGPTITVTVTLAVDPAILPGLWSVTSTESATAQGPPQGA